MKEKIANIIAEAIAWGDNPYNDMDAREGFAQKILDLPTDVMVEVDCPECTENKQECPMRYSRPLTVGEVLEKARQMARIGRF